MDGHPNDFAPEIECRDMLSLLFLDLVIDTICLFSVATVTILGGTHY
jgi:hypothetical protein